MTHRIAIALVVAAASLLPTLVAAEEFSIAGTWTGHRERMAVAEGWREGDATLVVSEVTGHTFRAVLRWSTPEGDKENPIVGA